MKALTASTFAPHLNGRFLLHAGSSEPREARLIEVTERGTQTAAESAPGERKPFSLVFRCGRDAPLPQGTYRLEHEELSSSKKDLLEIRTESWPAQDLRKGLVLMHASRHSDSKEERQTLYERGRELFAAAQKELLDWDTKTWPMLTLKALGEDSRVGFGHKISLGDLQ